MFLYNSYASQYPIFFYGFFVDVLRLDASSFQLEEEGEEEEGTTEAIEVRNNTVSDPSPDQDGYRVVRKLSQDYFRAKLVEHFDIMFHQGKIVWPNRVTQQQPHWVDEI